jgi:hypothetical protein
VNVIGRQLVKHAMTNRYFAVLSARQRLGGCAGLRCSITRGRSGWRPLPGQFGMPALGWSHQSGNWRRKRG